MQPFDPTVLLNRRRSRSAGGVCHASSAMEEAGSREPGLGSRLKR